MAYIQIRSANFANVHVRLDGSGVTHPDNGGGTVNCQYGGGPWETYTRVNNADGTVSFQAMSFASVFLRMDGRGVTRPVDAGAIACKWAIHRRSLGKVQHRLERRRNLVAPVKRIR